jgi:protein-disulfide isomerase
MRRMPTSTTRKKRNSLSPYAHLFIPIAFILGIGAGYLIWGHVDSAANATGIQRVAVTTDGQPSFGPKNAPITIVEFSDYQCPFCEQWDTQVYAQLLSSYPGKIRFIYMDLPLPMHPEAIPAAEAADCAGAQGAYWKYHDALFSLKYPLGRAAYEQYASELGLDTAAFTACLGAHTYLSAVKANASYAASLGLSGTPSFYINGRQLIGALPIGQFTAIIDEELALKK